MIEWYWYNSAKTIFLFYHIWNILTLMFLMLYLCIKNQLPTCRDGQNHHMLMILKSKSDHLNKGDLKSKSKSHWNSNDFKILFEIILKYSLYSSNIDVFCLLTALAIILDFPLSVGYPIQ